MRIAILTAADARRPRAWSGTPYFMARALARRFGDVRYLGPLHPAPELWGRARNRISMTLLGRRHPYEHGLALAREFGRRFRARIPADVDWIVAPAASPQIAFLETDVPILYTSDATFALMHEYYRVYSDLPERYARDAHEIERRALERAAAVFYPSEWAAGSARRDYGVPESKIRVAPYGANLSRAPSRESALAPKPDADLHLLFVGGDWERKGGPIAFETTALLRKQGLPVRLTVCGCVPPSRTRAEWMAVIPRLDKGKPEEEARLSRLLLEAHFLFVPSRHECFGIVFCEASAHGTPSVATETGGIAGAIRDGENGVLLPSDAAPEAFARRIAGAHGDRDRYRRLVAGSRAAYESRLNWESWAGTVAERLRD